MAASRLLWVHYSEPLARGALANPFAAPLPALLRRTWLENFLAKTLWENF